MMNIIWSKYRRNRVNGYIKYEVDIRKTVLNTCSFFNFSLPYIYIYTVVHYLNIEDEKCV